jgi:hypothetical protein
MSRTHFKIKWILRGLLFGIAFIAFFGLILMLLWNALIPQIFGLTKLTYLQSVGILILSKILFSGFGRKGGHLHDKREFLRKKFEERCRKETDEKETPATDQ